MGGWSRLENFWNQECEMVWRTVDGPAGLQGGLESCLMNLEHGGL